MVIANIKVNGHPYIKKSNQKTAYNKYLNKTVKYDTVAYKNWHIDALDQLGKMGYDPQFKKRQKLQPHLTALIDYPINLQCKFYMSTNGRADLSALYEGIQDVLVEVGILKDDNWHIVASHDGSGVQKDADNPRMEITITRKESDHEVYGHQANVSKRTHAPVDPAIF